MKAIMISIKPKWVAKILNGVKVIEIRKTMPKCELPVDVYIYCTKDKPYLANAIQIFTGNYACISNDDVSYEEHNLNGKVVAKFTLNKIRTSDMTNCLQGSSLSYDEVNEYTKGKKFYGWVIDNLVIFDRPRELSEFYKCFSRKYHKNYFAQDIHKENNVLVQPIRGGYEYTYPLTKAPQNFCYVEE